MFFLIIIVFFLIIILVLLIICIRLPSPRNPMSVETLVSKGFTQSQAQHYIQNRQAAIRRQSLVRAWTMGMPPMITKRLGQLHDFQESGQGVRIPLPPLTYEVPILNHDAMQEPDLSWLRVINLHWRDGFIVFVEEGHRYYIDGSLADLFVTSLIAEFFPAAQA